MDYYSKYIKYKLKNNNTYEQYMEGGSIRF